MVKIATDVFDMAFSIRCWNCEGENIIFLKEADLMAWKNDEGCIQDVLPYLSSGDRELLLSATCSKCFDKMFADDLDNDE